MLLANTVSFILFICGGFLVALTCRVVARDKSASRSPKYGKYRHVPLGKYIAENKWGLGLVAMFGLSAFLTAVLPMASNPAAIPVLPDDDEDVGAEIFPIVLSGTNPNLTREGDVVKLNRLTAPGMFDPALRQNASLWGLHVGQFRVCYYGMDNLWHESSFQVLETGYRWVANGSDESTGSGRAGIYSSGKRAESVLENLQWQAGYVPDRFYPGLKNIFWPDRYGNLPTDLTAGMMNNWPEFHNSTTEQAWSTPDNSSQVRGAIDYDDEIVFVSKNGRKVDDINWFQSIFAWPRRFEVMVNDYVDGGHAWMYVYYNPAMIATAPTPANQVGNDYHRALSYTAAGESDHVSFDTGTLSIVATNYKLAIDRYHASLFKDVEIAIPGSIRATVFSQAPKDLIQVQFEFDSGGTSPYDTIRAGWLPHFSASGTWYARTVPGLAPLQGSPNMEPGDTSTRDYDETQTGVGIIYHRGNPDITRHWAYGLQAAGAPLDLGWRSGASELRVPRWWDFSGTFPSAGIPGSIALRERWEHVDRTPSAFDTSEPGEGYFYMDCNLYVKNGSLPSDWTLLYRPYAPGFPYIDSRNDVFSMSSAGYRDLAATVDGPVLLLVERVAIAKATIELEWLRDYGPEYIGLLSNEGNTSRYDGLVQNCELFYQNDVVAFPTCLETHNNIFITPGLLPIMMDPNTALQVHHMYGYFKTMQFDPSISTGTRIYLGCGAGITDTMYGMTMSLLNNQEWTSAKDFPHYYGMEQPVPGGDGVVTSTRVYHPWHWMDDAHGSLVPDDWYGGSNKPVAKVYTLDGNPSNDGAWYTANSDLLADGATRPYHQWCDYTGTTIWRREQWLGTAGWRDHIKTRGDATVYGTRDEGWSTEHEPNPRTPRNQYATTTVSHINYPSDWYIVDVPGAGNMWVYVPLRETYEMQSQGYTGPLQTSAAHPVNDAAMAIKDSDMKEIGLFKARLAFGAQAIPFTLKWAFNDWAIDDNATAAMTIGKREWVRNRFQLGNMLVVTHQVARWPQITTFRPVPPHGSFYKSGDLVTLELISTWFGDDISIRFDGITAAGTSVSPSESIGNGQYRHVVTFTWTGASDGDNVGPLLGQRGDYYWVYADFGSPVQGTASCGLFRDTQAPTPAQFSLPATTPANYVILDWTACPGADNSDGTLPPPDECGIANYVVNRNGVDIGTVPRDNTLFFIDDNWGAGFPSGTILQYRLKTVDLAGNSATHGPVTTVIDSIPNYGTWNPQWNKDLDGPASNENPVAAHGNMMLKWDASAPYSGLITSFSILYGTSPMGPFSTLLSGISPTVYNCTVDWGTIPDLRDDTYWFKLRSHLSGSSVDSIPIPVIHDAGTGSSAPIPATIAWPYGPVYQPTWRVVPIDITGAGIAIDPGFYSDGDPSNTGSGIWKYGIYRIETDDPGTWPSWPAIDAPIAMVDRETMESDVWYHDDPSLVNGRYYRYRVFAFDHASACPSTAYPVGMAYSDFIEFQFDSGNFDPYYLFVENVSTNFLEVYDIIPFPVFVTIRNVGTITTTVQAVNLSITQGGIDVTGLFNLSGPVPIVGTSLPPGESRVYEFEVLSGMVVTGQVEITANVTWFSGSAAYERSPAIVHIYETTGFLPLEIRGIIGPDHVYLDGNFGVFTFQVYNPHPLTAQLESATIVIDGMASTGQFNIVRTWPASLPVSIAPLDNITVAFAVAAPGTTPVGACVMNASVTGWAGGMNVSSSGSISPASFSVLISPPVVVVDVFVQDVDVVEGKTFTVVVNYTNTGASPVDGWDGMLVLDPAGRLLVANDPVPVFLAASGGTGTQAFVVRVEDPVAAGEVVVGCQASGTYDDGVNISAQVAASAQASQSVVIWNKAILAIQGIAVNATDVVAGGDIELAITYENAGTPGNAVQALEVGSGVAFLPDYFSVVYFGPTTSVVAGGTATQLLVLRCNTSIPSDGSVLINVTASGVEQYSGASLSASLTTSVIAWRHAALVNITALSANVTDVVEGQDFMVTVSFENNGNVDAINLSVAIVFDPAWCTVLTVHAPVTLHPGGDTVTQQFVMRCDGTIPSGDMVSILANLTGAEDVTGKAFDVSACTSVYAWKHAALCITDMPSERPFVIAGSELSIGIVHGNTGDVNVSAVGVTLTYEPAWIAPYFTTTSITPSSFTMGPGQSGVVQQVVIRCASPLPAGSIVTITVLASGIEAYTGNTMVASSSINVTAWRGAELEITSIVANATDVVAGSTVSLTVTYRNTGDLLLSGAGSLLSFTPYYLETTSITPSSVELNAGASGVTQAFVVGYNESTWGSGPVNVTVHAGGMEDLSGTPRLANASIMINAWLPAVLSNVTVLANATDVVEGCDVELTLLYGNAGGVSLINVTPVLFSVPDYFSMVSTSPPTVTVDAGQWNVSQVAVIRCHESIGSSASVVVHVNVTATEQYTGRVVTATSATAIACWKRAVPSITSMVANATDVVEGQDIAIMLAYANAGDVSLEYVFPTFAFDPAVFTTVRVDPATVILPAGQAGVVQTVVIRCQSPLETSSVVVMNASVHGTEEHSGRFVAATSTISINSWKHAALIITGMASNATVAGIASVVEGHDVSITITYANTGDVQVIDVVPSLDFDPAYFSTVSTTPSAVTVHPGQAGMTQVVVVRCTRSIPATRTVVVSAHATGHEQHTDINVTATSNMTVNAWRRAVLAIERIFANTTALEDGHDVLFKVTWSNLNPDGAQLVNVTVTLAFFPGDSFEIVHVSPVIPSFCACQANITHQFTLRYSHPVPKRDNATILVTITCTEFITGEALSVETSLTLNVKLETFENPELATYLGYSWIVIFSMAGIVFIGKKSPALRNGRKLRQ